MTNLTSDAGTLALLPRRMMRFPLALKFLLALGSLLLALSLGVSLLFFLEARKAANAALGSEGDAIVSSLNFAIEVLLDKSDTSAIERVVSNAALLPEVRQILVTDPTGKVIASSDRLEMGTMTGSPHVRAFLERGEHKRKVIEGPKGDLFILSALRRGQYQSITDSGMIGAIQITVDRRSIEAEAELGTLRTLGIHLGSYALLSALVALALHRLVVAPLYRLAEAAGRVRAGDHAVHSGIRSRDEIGLVSEEFDRMVEQVDRTVDTLEEKVGERTRELLRTQEETDRIKGDLISIVSHELRTPLTAIRGSLGLLVGGVTGALPQETTELLVIAERNTMRLIALVNDILDLDRLQRGILDIQVAPVAAGRIIERSVESVAAFATEEGIRIEVDEAQGDVLGDERRLVQVLVNLLSNAVKFSPSGSVVRVSAARRGAEVEFRVADAGPGVPADHRERIFERFHQVESPATRAHGGTGLGLSISKALVTEHSGMIGIESEEGRGSTFWFRIPRADMN